MDLQQIVATFAAHQWLALALFGAVYLRKLVSPGSAFPVNFSPNWRPVFVALFGAVVLGLTADEGGASLGMAILAGFGGFVAAGAMDGMLVAIWGNAANAPSWARALVFVVDDIAGGGGGGGSASKQNAVDPVTAAANKLSPPTSKRVLLPALAGVLVLALTGCAAFWGTASATLDCASKVSEDAAQNMDVAHIVADLPSQCGMDAAAVMAILLASRDGKVQASPAFAEAVRARAMLASPPAAACGK